MPSTEQARDTLHIRQSTDSAGKFSVLLRLKSTGQSAEASFDFKLTPQDDEDLRWYLEDYLQYPHDPAPKTAARIEKRMAQLGTQLFDAVFDSGKHNRLLWAEVRNRLSELRIEIVTSVREATAIPWELIRESFSNEILALRTAAFVRTHHDAVHKPQRVTLESGPIRILVVICRPKQDEDVPFRSVAGRLIKSLSADTRAVYELHVLRPPTFEQLGKTLRAARADDKPFHVVHFDGHGMYADFPETNEAAAWLQKLAPLMLGGPRTGAHGYLLFENPEVEENMQLVGGPTLGKLLHETNTPVLVLNACRSAHAEAPAEPESAAVGSDEAHAQIDAYGSLAQEVIHAGVTGVVAMRYNVYVVTAAQFIADMYAALLQGKSLGAAVTLGRKQLAEKPMREIAYQPRPLADWCVPIVYEALPIVLFPKKEDAPGLSINVETDGASTEAGALDKELPRPPDVGFFGRDETLLALDRAFDSQRVVLLHAYAGSGKTATAAEFARWYAMTGGVKGPVLFTSFEQHLPLARVLDRIGQVFGPALEQSGVNWLTLEDTDRRAVALQVLTQIPVLWIWDNVETVAGFPAGSESAWTDDQQAELVDFLRDAAGTEAKFLLTSRRDERAWLGDELPRRVEVPPMPMQERVQLARALAEKHGRRLTDVADWRPLLRFTVGNPLTITVLVGQALRDGLKTREQIEAFVAKLRAGESAFEDESDRGRRRSLGASLDYGFQDAFTETQRRQLGCLHFFQGFVDVHVLELMGDPKFAEFVNTRSTTAETYDSLPELRGLDRDTGMALLDRAAEIGLLTAHGDGYYSIHPALPWFFKSLFTESYPAPADSAQPNPQLAATRAFVEAMGELGAYYHRQYNEGDRDVIGPLTAEEANLIEARRLARKHSWWGPVISTMQGLHVLYDHTGRRSEWRRLVEEIVPDFVDPATDGPLLGREDDWGVVTGYRVRLADESRQWPEAERLQRLRVDRNRRHAAAALQVEPKALDDVQRNTIRSLAVSLEALGNVQRELEQPNCVESYQEALVLADRIDDRAGAAVCSRNLGDAYMQIAGIRDFGQAEDWYRRSLGMYKEDERHDRAQCLGRLGSVAFRRSVEARDADKPEAEVLRHLNDALQATHQALELLPENAVKDLAGAHNQLGMIYNKGDEIDRALAYYRESIRLKEASEDPYGAAEIRFNVALALADSGRLVDAMDYARAALREFSTFGSSAADMNQRTQELIHSIERSGLSERMSSER